MEVTDQVLGDEFLLPCRRGRSIGEGTFASVHRAQLEGSGEVVAVKELKLKLKLKDSSSTLFSAGAGAVARRRNEEEDDSIDVSKLKTHLSMLRQVRHPRLGEMLGFRTALDSICIIMEYVPGGSLQKVLEEYGPLSAPVVKKSARQLLQGLDHLHMQRDPEIIHGDIKSSNVLVDLEFNMKLVDFGMTTYRPTAALKSMQFVPWMAPEVLTGEGSLTKAADIYAFGCVVSEMVTGLKPWAHLYFRDATEAVEFITSPDTSLQAPPGVGSFGADFLTKCLTRDPDARSSSADLLRHRFVR